MGEADRYQDYRRPRNRFTLGDSSNALVALITINIIFFITLSVVEVIYANVQGNRAGFMADALPWFQMPASLPALATRPWTLLTYMFTHYGFLPMLGNTLWLWAYGLILQQLTGNTKLIPIYIYGGLAGALVFILVSHLPFARLTVEQASLLGGNAATMAVAAAATMLAPDYRFFRNIGGGIPIWVLTVLYVLIDFSGIARGNVPESFSHLAGAGAGLLFVYFVRRGKDGSVWMNNLYEWFMNLFNPQKRNPRENNIREKVFYNAGERKPYKKTSNVTQQRVDEILDKINQKGYHFLTEEEKSILKRAAEEDLD